jgi:hypothetical protein
MDADATRGWLREAIERFPDKAPALRRLALRDQTFRSLCEDYGLAHASLAGFQARTDAADRPEIADYRALIAELETEIERSLRGDAGRS